MNIDRAQKLITGEISLKDLTKDELRDYFTLDSTRLVPVYGGCACCESLYVVGHEQAGYRLSISEAQLEETYNECTNPIE